MRNEFSPKIKHVKTDIEKRIKAATSETKKKKKERKNLQYTFADKSNCISHTSVFIEKLVFRNDWNNNMMIRLLTSLLIDKATLFKM
jgi:hypothetical protein